MIITSWSNRVLTRFLFYKCKSLRGIVAFAQWQVLRGTCILHPSKIRTISSMVKYYALCNLGTAGEAPNTTFFNQVPKGWVWRIGCFGALIRRMRCGLPSKGLPQRIWCGARLFARRSSELRSEHAGYCGDTLRIATFPVYAIFLGKLPAALREVFDEVGGMIVAHDAVEGK